MVAFGDLVCDVGVEARVGIAVHLGLQISHQPPALL